MGNIAQRRAKNTADKIAEHKDNQVNGGKKNDLCHKNPNRCSKTIEKLSSKPTDCVIRVQETNIEVHRNVMSLVSSYFEASVRFESLTDNNGESTDHLVTIELDDMNEEAVRALIDYAYNGSIYLKKQNAPEILKCADFFCVESVSESCVKFLAEALEYNEVTELMKISKKIHDENYPLHKVLILFTAQNFSLFLQNKSYLDFDIDFLVEVLSNDKLVVMEELVCGDKTEFYFTTPARQEEIVLKCVIQYMQHVRDNSILPKLVKKCVRLALISSDVRNKLQQEEPIASCQECSDFFKCIDEKLNTSESGFSKRLKPRDLKDVLVICWTPALNNVSNAKNAESRVDETPLDSFDDSELLTELSPVIFVTGLTTYEHTACTQVHIAGLKINYSNGVNVQHGSDYSCGYGMPRGKGCELNLEEDERIVKVSLSSFLRCSYDPKSGPLYDCCSFQTNTGRGDCTYTEIAKPHPSACLAFIKGKTNSYSLERKHLEFGWIYNRKMAAL